jgi:tetratricopeptide (TPR) repeat protein
MKTLMKFAAAIVAIVTFGQQIPETGAQGIQLLIEDDQLLKNGRNAVHAGNLEKALFYYEEALKRKASLSRIELVAIHSDLGVTYMYLERFEEAIAQWESSLEIQSNKWETLNNLGTVYLVMGQYQNALDAYNRALAMKPKSKILLLNLDIARTRLLETNIGLGLDNK